MPQHGDIRLWTSSHIRGRGSFRGSFVRYAVMTPPDWLTIISITTFKIRKNILSAV
jgi:hypothetical protein